MQIKDRAKYPVKVKNKLLRISLFNYCMLDMFDMIILDLEKL